MSHFGTKQFTKHKLGLMESSGGAPYVHGRPSGSDNDNDMEADDHGMAAAKSSNSAHFRHGGAAKKPHAGHRLRRATGGQVRHSDEAEDKALVKRMVKHEALSGKKHGGRLRRAEGGGVRSEGARDSENEERVGKMSASEREEYANEKKGGRIHRAHGGKAKGKTTVNIVIGRSGQEPHPMPVAPPPPAPPPGGGGGAPPPPHPGMPGMMPGMGMPIGGGAMPPLMIGRARGGKVMETFGAGSGEGRLEKTAREKRRLS